MSKRVLITGASGGFGTAARALLEARGDRVAGIDLHAGDGVVGCDITDGDAVADAVQEAAGLLGGGIDVLVNNAGLGTSSEVGGGLESEDRAVLEVNLCGSWNVTAAALPYLLESRGQVVNVASLLAVVTFPRTGAYTASKRALTGLSDVLRAEHGGELAVTTVYPGYSPTAIHDAPEQRSGLNLRDAGIPAETPEQVAKAIVRAIDRRPRDQATSLTGEFVLRAARHLPRTVDFFVGRKAGAMLQAAGPGADHSTPKSDSAPSISSASKAPAGPSAPVRS
ncbi:MAG: hypothetical protein QOJ07_3880 [Thermoleophilaceae bacterium]|jgi:short-subunit dehydrogenase|nr:hypothetical protein [Thermoleophilaceae bacterium]